MAEYRSSEAVKTWMAGTERRFDTLTIAEYGRWNEAQADERELENTLKTQGLKAAMNQAERMAVVGGYLDPNRADGRIFFEADAPRDPFTTERERTMEREMHDDVSYFFDYNRFGYDALALEAHKTWREPDGTQRSDFILLDLHEGDSGGQIIERFEAEVARLTEMQKTDGLETAMNEAERMAVANGLLEGERADPRLFAQGPPDQFATLRERELGTADIPKTQPEYQIDAISANGVSRLDVLKSWGDEDREWERLLIPQSDWETARANAEAVHDMLDQGDLQGAMTLVELAAIEAGVINPQRADPRLFTAGPPDPFTTIRESELAREVDVTEMDTEPYIPVTLETEAPDYPTMYREFAAEAAREREANAALEGAAWFEATFEKSEMELLQPVHDTLNYAVVVQETDPWTRELLVEKYWKEPGGYLGMQSVTLDTWDSDDEKGHEQAEQAREALLEVHDERGLEAMMHQAELTAIRNDWLVADRVDTRLFTQGPPDRFETLAQQLQNEINPYWNTDSEKVEDPAPQSGVENPYWRLDTLPVTNPDGEPLGRALHMVVYPGVERGPDAVGSLTIAEDEPFRMLEMAHFETPEAVDRFGKEFNGYLIPGLLDGPELAMEVARLEGLPMEWKTLEGDDLKAYQNAELTLTRDPSDWHPYDPNAEWDARIATEGLYTDSIQQVVERDEQESVSGTPELDF